MPDVRHLRTILEKPTTIVFIIALITRITVWILIPTDWNSDSYHHWQISYLSLKIGFSQGRLWDLNGCEYFWGIIPHVINAVIMALFRTASILPYRVFNLFFGGINAVLVSKAGKRFFSERTGFYSGLLFAVFPVASIFDILAMQDTLALTFLLSSLLLIRENPFWSGLLLGLAGQSRTELFLVGIIILMGYCLRERLYTESLPFLIGWLAVTFIFSAFMFTQTGHPFYHLYVSLLNIFGGWKPENLGRPFYDLMWSWMIWKLRVWPTKATGIIILGMGIASASWIPYMARKKWVRYQPQLYFVTTASVLTPIFITYLGSNQLSFLVMLRMIVPIMALGLPLIIHYSTLFWRRTGIDYDFTFIEPILILLFLTSFLYFVPVYSGYQIHTETAFASADIAYLEYTGGRIVCDYPTMNYRFISEHKIEPGDILSNHYSPAYYGIEEPIEYVRWLASNNVTLWLYAEDRAEPVWNVLSKNYPDLLVFIESTPDAQIYRVNQTEVHRILLDG